MENLIRIAKTLIAEGMTPKKAVTLVASSFGWDAKFLEKSVKSQFTLSHI
jgi:hypothetical protein